MLWYDLGSRFGMNLSLVPGSSYAGDRSFKEVLYETLRDFPFTQQFSTHHKVQDWCVFLSCSQTFHLGAHRSFLRPTSSTSIQVDESSRSFDERCTSYHERWTKFSSTKSDPSPKNDLHEVFDSISQKLLLLSPVFFRN